MTSIPKRIDIGERLNGIPADTWNLFADRSDGFRPKAPTPPQVARVSDPRGVFVQVKNNSGVAVPRGGVMAISGPRVTADLDQESLTVPWVLGVAPDEAAYGRDSVVIVTERIGAGELGAAIATGVVWAQVNVGNVNDTHAKASDGVTGNLVSGTEGFRLLSKNGTGLQWCLVLLDRAVEGDNIDRSHTVVTVNNNTGADFTQGGCIGFDYTNFSTPAAGDIEATPIVVEGKVPIVENLSVAGSTLQRIAVPLVDIPDGGSGLAAISGYVYAKVKLTSNAMRGSNICATIPEDNDTGHFETSSEGFRIIRSEGWSGGVGDVDWAIVNLDEDLGAYGTEPPIVLHEGYWVDFAGTATNLDDDFDGCIFFNKASRAYDLQLRYELEKRTSCSAVERFIKVLMAGTYEVEFFGYFRATPTWTTPTESYTTSTSVGHTHNVTARSQVEQWIAPTVELFGHATSSPTSGFGSMNVVLAEWERITSGASPSIDSGAKLLYRRWIFALPAVPYNLGFGLTSPASHITSSRDIFADMDRCECRITRRRSTEIAIASV